MDDNRRYLQRRWYRVFEEQYELSTEVFWVLAGSGDGMSAEECHQAVLSQGSLNAKDGLTLDGIADMLRMMYLEGWVENKEYPRGPKYYPTTIAFDVHVS